MHVYIVDLSVCGKRRNAPIEDINGALLQLPNFAK